ncbi:phage tail tip fiber protein [Enterobacter asburiae]
MSEKIITLSGAATDVLYSLFFRGALQSGDLPAKSGAAELRELGFAETRHTATEYQKENYFTFLTAEGQKFAIKHLADTRFGQQVDKQYRSAITIGVELDTSYAIKAIEEINEHIRNSDAFKLLKDGWSHEKNGTVIINNGQVFISDAIIQDGSITKAKIGNALPSNNLDASTSINAILENAAREGAQDGAKRAAEDLKVKGKTKDIQLAMLYNGEHFAGFGLAVDGRLLSQQCNAQVLQDEAARGIAKLQVTFALKEAQTKNPVHIVLSELRNSRGW